MTNLPTICPVCGYAMVHPSHGNYARCSQCNLIISLKNVLKKTIADLSAELAARNERIAKLEGLLAEVLSNCCWSSFRGEWMLPRKDYDHIHNLLGGSNVD